LIYDDCIQLFTFHFSGVLIMRIFRSADLVGHPANDFADLWARIAARLHASPTQQGAPKQPSAMSELRRALAAEHLYETMARSKARPQDASDEVFSTYYGEQRSRVRRSRIITSDLP
jgi:hypothetical protein